MTGYDGFTILFYIEILEKKLYKKKNIEPVITCHTDTGGEGVNSMTNEEALEWFREDLKKYRHRLKNAVNRGDTAASQNITGRIAAYIKAIEALKFSNSDNSFPIV